MKVLSSSLSTLCLGSVPINFLGCVLLGPKVKKDLLPENGTIERGHSAIDVIAVAVVMIVKRETA